MEVCPVPAPEETTRTVRLSEEERIVSFRVVDGWRQKELNCPDGFFLQYLQTLQVQGYRFQ